MNPSERTTGRQLGAAATFWRVEGSLLNLSGLRPVAFVCWNAQRFSERWLRSAGLLLVALTRPLLYLADRVFATRVLHTLLRGVSRDRLDLLGEEYFHYVLKPRLKSRGVEKLREVRPGNGRVVLVSQCLDHVMRPLAAFLGVEQVVANRLEFRDGVATGRLLDPVIPPRGPWARLIGRQPDGSVSVQQLSREMGRATQPEAVSRVIVPAGRQLPQRVGPLILLDSEKKLEPLSVRQVLAGKHVLLIGATGFIGKVWLATLLRDLPELGRFYLLIRRQRTSSAQRRFQRIVEESPVFEPFHDRYGDGLMRLLERRVEVVEGDVSRPGLGINPEMRRRLAAGLDLVVNCSGLTDFNPDLRDALAMNVDGTLHVIDFARQCQRAALLHLSTCYVVGARDGRVSEELAPNYTPAHVPDFDAEREWESLHELVKKAAARSESPELTEEFRREALKRAPRGKTLSLAELENHIRRYRARWLRTHLIEAGTRRAKELGWPNTYTFTKSLTESLLQKRGADLPVAVARPSIVETSLQQPFRGWNEGINTSAPLSYLLGTYFRQLPSNQRKCLDLIPVDLVCRGMTLVAAALVARRHHRLYQLATSALNPCNMRRSIELTSLAHRKHYRAQEGLEHWLRSRFDTIPVSKARYQKFSAPGQKAIVQLLKRVIAPLPFVRSRLERRERKLEKVEKLIELYEPFILLNEHVFEAENVERLSAALPPEEKEAFGYDARSIDWWDYWINVHIPALRKWVYPLIEGRPLEYRPRRGAALATPAPPGAAEAGREAAPTTP